MADYLITCCWLSDNQLLIIWLSSDAYLILVANASNGVSVKFSMWEEFFLNEREKDSCVILYTDTQCVILHIMCNFTHSVYFTQSV